MNTCVLCLSRRNAFECTIRSRSRWNGVRSGESSSAVARRAGYERAASGDRDASSRAVMRSWKEVPAATVTPPIVSAPAAAPALAVRYERLERRGPVVDLVEDDRAREARR